MQRLIPLVFLGVTGLLAATSAQAAVELAAPFGDHMMLQRDAKAAIWGTAEAGETVTVEFAGQKVTAKADGEGRWKAHLEPLEASAQGRTLKATAASGSANVDDVLVGEVWVVVTQGSTVKQMGPPVPEHLHGKIERQSIQESDSDIAQADLPAVRVHYGGQWHVVTPQTAGPMPAPAFYFARALHRDLEVPAAVIFLPNRGNIQAWTNREHLQADPELAAITTKLYKRYLDAYPERVAEYEKALAEYNKLPRKDKQRAPEPVPPIDPAPEKYPDVPGMAFAERLEPLAGLGIRGMAYGGGPESTWAFRPVMDYHKILPTMIDSWRDAWGDDDLPLMLIQFSSDVPEPSRVPRQPGPRTYLQDIQREVAQAKANVGLVVTADLPFAKNDAIVNRTLGDRLARAAEALAYGKNIVPTGPLYKPGSFTARDGKAYVGFSNVDGGLRIGGGLSKMGGNLDGFAIAGDDRYWYVAEAKIEDGHVVVWSEDVPEPAAVRYAMSERSPISLFNEIGLPASPFRTDDWSLDIPERGEHKATVARVEQAPKIDGRLSEGEWPGKPLTDFMIRHTYRVAENPTRVWLAYDAENLYVGGDAVMMSDYPIAKVREKDNTAIVYDDAFEILLDVDQDKRDFYRVAMNPRRTVMDGIGFNNSFGSSDLVHLHLLVAGRGFSTAWDSEAKVGTGLGDESWTFEMAIPWKSLGVETPEAGKDFGLQLIRTAAAEPFVTSGAFEQLMKTALYNEWSQWVNTGRGYHTGGMLPFERHVHRPARFGTMTLGE